MNPLISRTALIYGESLYTLANKRVAVFGLGGVGGHVAEALARCGVGTLDLFDSDIVCPTNINRQLIALQKTIGMPKVEAMAQRIHDINPEIKTNTYNIFYTADNADTVDLSVYDYVVDAIDTVSAKLELATRCYNLKIPIISSMGAGNKIEPSMLQVADIYKTEVCPLAKVMRYELKKRGIKKLKVVYSKEKPRVPMSEYLDEADRNSKRRQVPGSTAFVPAVAGLIIAGEVVNDLTGIRKKQ